MCLISHLKLAFRGDMFKFFKKILLTFYKDLRTKMSYVSVSSKKTWEESFVGLFFLSYFIFKLYFFL